MSYRTITLLAILLALLGQYLDASRQVPERGAVNRALLPADTPLDAQVDDTIAAIRASPAAGGSIEAVAGGSALLLKSAITITEAMIWARHDEIGSVADTTALWSTPGDPDAAASAPGLDNRHHFVNAYLEGFRPFDTDNIWVPLYTIGRVKTYEFDHASVTGYQERWQTSREAFYYNRGDCEDHALALADWLIEMGEDARVVLGKLRGEGHAWVALFRGGQVYVLEATQKHRRQGPQQLKLASMLPNYQPRMMFNREFFWMNTGSPLTLSYGADQWVKRSRYQPARRSLPSALSGRHNRRAEPPNSAY